MSCGQAFEDDRVGRYVAAELSDAERDAFEEHFLGCAACREALEVHLDLVDALRARRPAAAAALPSRVRSTASPSARWSGLAAAAVLVIGVAGWMGGRQSAAQRFQTERDALEGSARQLQDQLRRSQFQQDQMRAELDRERGARAATSFALSPGLERGEGAPAPLSLASTVTEVRFELDLQTVRSYSTFQAELRGPKGDVLWSQSRLRAEGPEGERVLVVRVPARVLGIGDHELVLRGTNVKGAIEDAAVYSFRLRKP
jgi:hypothetical protein